MRDLRPADLQDFPGFSGTNYPSLKIVVSPVRVWVSPFLDCVERTFAASAEDVFDAWTSPEGMRRWFHCGPDWETPQAEDSQDASCVAYAAARR